MKKEMMLLVGGIGVAILGAKSLKNKGVSQTATTPAAVPSFSPEGLNIDPKTVTK